MNIPSLHGSPIEAYYLERDPGTCISNNTLKFQHYYFRLILALLLRLNGKPLQATCSAATEKDADPSTERDVQDI